MPYLSQKLSWPILTKDGGCAGIRHSQHVVASVNGPPSGPNWIHEIKHDGPQRQRRTV